MGLRGLAKVCGMCVRDLQHCINKICMDLNNVGICMYGVDIRTV
jgi:hypothetical protein